MKSSYARQHLHPECPYSTTMKASSRTRIERMRETSTIRYGLHNGKKLLILLSMRLWCDLWCLFDLTNCLHHSSISAEGG